MESREYSRNDAIATTDTSNARVNVDDVGRIGKDIPGGTVAVQQTRIRNVTARL